MGVILGLATLKLAVWLSIESGLQDRRSLYLPYVRVVYLVICMADLWRVSMDTRCIVDIVLRG